MLETIKLYDFNTDIVFRREKESLRLAFHVTFFLILICSGKPLSLPVLFDAGPGAPRRVPARHRPHGHLCRRHHSLLQTG